MLGNEHFKQQRERADNPVSREKSNLFFYNMSISIGDELQDLTGAFLSPAISSGPTRVLDLCMAPGGYSASASKHNPGALIRGISLPPSQGGHEMLFTSPNLQVLFLDITMLAAEFGTTNIPENHPDASSFILDRPFLGQSFHLVFCDGQVLRTHARGEHRERYEALRLSVSQLILAVQRIESGGRLVMLLHRIDSWRSLHLIHQISQFADVQLFKPARMHADRGSFYLVATNLKPESEAAKETIEGWKRTWWKSTFDVEDGMGNDEVMNDEELVRSVLNEFGERFIDMSRPVWKIQEEALSKKEYTQ